MNRIPVEEIDRLRCRMDNPDAEPLTQEEVLDALAGARCLLDLVVPSLTDCIDQGTICEVTEYIRDIADRIYGCIFDPEDDE